MVWFFLRAVAFAFGLGIALPAMAAGCPPGFPLSSTCTNIEQYTYAAPQGQAIAPYSSGLRIGVAPNPSDNSFQYIPANLLATLNDIQTLTRKTLNNPIINGGTLNGVFGGNPVFSGIPNFTGLLSVTCSSGLALDAAGNLGKVACGGGSSGFPITLGSTTINGSSTTTAIAGLTLAGPTLTGNVAGNPNFTGQPMYTGLSTGTPIWCLALDSSNNLIKVAAVSGSCAGSGPPSTHLLLLNAGGNVLLNAGGKVLLNAS